MKLTRPRLPPHAKAFEPFLAAKNLSGRVMNAHTAMTVFPDLHDAFSKVCTSAMILRESLDAAVEAVVKRENRTQRHGGKGGSAAVEQTYLVVLMGFMSELRRDPGPVLESLAEVGKRETDAYGNGKSEREAVQEEVELWRNEVAQCTDQMEKMHQTASSLR